jgi:hypothetical protein
MTTAFLEAQRQQTSMDIGFAPAGEDESYRVIISEDSILKPGDPNMPFMVPALLKKPAMLHAYIYVENTPVNKKDPLGVASCGGCDLDTCLNGCAAGGRAWQDFCRSLGDPRLCAGCSRRFRTSPVL